MRKSFDPQKISGELAMPIEDFEASFESLKRMGVIFTFAKNPRDFGRKKFPIRLIGKPPVSPDDPAAVSFGPFAVKREIYDQARESNANPDIFKAYLGLLRLIFEKTGGTVEGYRFEAKEEKVDEFISTIDFWDVENPVICELFVWIIPNEKCKQFVEELTGKKYGKDDYSWWNTKLDLGEDFIPSTMNDYPDQYGLIPSDLIDKWARYLPTIAWQTTMFLYQKVTRNNNMDFAFQNLDHLLSEIKDGIEKSGLKTEKIEGSLVDRELLAKELCDLNSLTYPINETTMLEFLQQIGFIFVSQSKGRVTYKLVENLPSPKKILRIPKNWESKMNKFVSSGTILFAYLSTEEIVEK